MEAGEKCITPLFGHNILVWTLKIHYKIKSVSTTANNVKFSEIYSAGVNKMEKWKKTDLTIWE
jgi:hypothetical protein